MWPHCGGGGHCSCHYPCKECRFPEDRNPGFLSLYSLPARPTLQGECDWLRVEASSNLDQVEGSGVPWGRQEGHGVSQQCVDRTQWLCVALSCNPSCSLMAKLPLQSPGSVRAPPAGSAAALRVEMDMTCGSWTPCFSEERWHPGSFLCNKHSSTPTACQAYC